MERTTEILTVTSTGQFPSVGMLRRLPREKTLKMVFAGAVQEQREIFGRKLKSKLRGFTVAIHTTEPEINIARLVTDKEIEDHQLFFEKCAQDYRELGQRLVLALADKLNIEIGKDLPLNLFERLKRDKRQSGRFNGWRYFLHGIHCGFEHKATGQRIEVCLLFGLEFGDLDPYFFSRFIKSTPAYKPLPVEIYEDYADGLRIIEKMLSLGRFERINNESGSGGIVVKNRDKAVRNASPDGAVKQAKAKFNLLRFFGLK